MHLDKNVKIMAEEVKLDVVSKSIFDGSFVTDKDFLEKEWEDIWNTWVDLEENDFVMEAVVEEELEAIEKDINLDEEDLDEEEIIVKKVDERKPPNHIQIAEAIDTLPLALGSTESSFELSHELDSIQGYLQKQQMNGNK